MFLKLLKWLCLVYLTCVMIILPTAPAALFYCVYLMNSGQLEHREVDQYVAYGALATMIIFASGFLIRGILENQIEPRLKRAGESA